jgi:hypothetical protein
MGTTSKQTTYSSIGAKKSNNRKMSKSRKRKNRSSSPYMSGKVIHEGNPIYFPKRKKLKGWQKVA